MGNEISLLFEYYGNLILCVENSDDLRLKGGLETVEVENIDIEFIKCVD